MKKIPDVNALKKLFLQYVWYTPVDKVSKTRARIMTGLQIAHLVVRDLMDGMITLRAMGLVYTTILALVPLLAVSFSVLKGFGVHNQIEPMLQGLLQPLGEKGIEVSNKIIEFVNNTRAGVLGSLGLALLMYTVVSLLQKIERAFNYTWRVSQHRSIGQRFSDYITVVLIGPVLLFSALGVTASISSNTIMQHLMEIKSIGFLVELTGYLLPYILVISAFTLIYIFVPNKKVKIKSALVGAIIAGLLWETAGWVFTSFISGSTKYTAIYSAFATLIIFFIWLYMNWLILLIGCSITFYHQQPAYRHLGPRVLRLSNRLRESLSLNIMTLIGRHYYLKKPAWSIDALVNSMGITAEVCELLVGRLVKAGFLVETCNSPVSYLPASDPDTLLLIDIVFALRKSEEDNYLAFNSVKIEPETKDVYAEIEQSIAQALNKRTLKDLSVGSLDGQTPGIRQES